MLKSSGEFVLIETINIALELFEANRKLKEDITERKKIEEALTESEGKYRDLAEKSHVMICEIDGQGKFLYVNTAYKFILGYEPDELIGCSAFEIGHPDQAEKASCKT